MDIGAITIRMAADTAAVRADIAAVQNLMGSAANSAVADATRAASAIKDYEAAAGAAATATVTVSKANEQWMSKLAQQSDQIRMTQAEILRMEAAIRGVSDQAEPYIRNIESATAKTHELSLANSGVTRELSIMGGEVLRGNWTRLEGSMTVLANRTGATAIAIQALASPIGLAVVGLTALAGVTVALGLHNEHILETSNLMQTQLAATGRAGELSSGQLAEMVHQLQLMPGVSRDMAVEMVEAFTKSKAVSTDLFQTITLDAANFSYVTGEKGPEAAKRLAAALADPAKGAHQMATEFGLLTTEQMLQIEAMVKHGDVLGAQADLAALLHEKLANLRTQAMTPLGTATNDLYKSWDKLTDSFSHSDGINGFNIAITKTVSAFAWIVDHGDAIAHVLSAAIPGMNAITGAASALGARTPTTSNVVSGAIGGISNDQDIQHRTDALLEQGRALESVAAKEKDYQDKLKEYKTLIAEVAKEDGDHTQTIAALKDQMQGLIEQHDKHIPKVHQVASAYDSLIDQILKFDAATNAEWTSGEKVTASQKEWIEKTTQLNEALQKGSISLVQWTVAMGVLQAVVANRSELDDFNKVVKETAAYFEDLNKQGLALVNSTDKQSDSLDHQIEKQKEALAEVGKSKTEIEALRSQRLLDAADADEETAAQLRVNLAIADAGPLMNAYYNQRADALDKIAAKERRLAGIDKELGAAQDLAASARKAEEAWTSSEKHIENGLYDSITGGGNRALKQLVKDFELAFARMVLNPIVQPISQGLASLMNPTAASAAGSPFGFLGSMFGGGSSSWSLSNVGTMGSGIGGFLGFGGSAAASGAVTAGSTSAFELADSVYAGSTAAAGGAGLMATLGAAMPWIGGALAIGSALGLFGKSHGPKTESAFGSGVPGSFTGDASGATTIGQGIQSQYAAIAGALGLSTPLANLGVFYSRDPNGTAQTQLDIHGGSYSRAAVTGGIENVGRSDADFQQAVATASAQLILKNLQEQASGAIGDYLKSIDITTASLEEMNKALQVAQDVGTFDKAVTALGGSFADLTKLTVAQKDAMVQAFGGIQGFTNELNQFYADFTTTAEKNDAIWRGLVKTFTDANVVLPSTAEGFEAAVKAAIAAGDTHALQTLLGAESAFKQLYGAIGQTATAATNATAAIDSWQKSYFESWAAINKASQSANAVVSNAIAAAEDAAIVARNKAFNDLKSQFDTLLQSVKDGVDKIRGAWISNTAGQTLSGAQAMFNALVAEAKAGGADAPYAYSQLTAAANAVVALAPTQSMNAAQARMIEAQTAQALENIQGPLAQQRQQALSDFGLNRASPWIASSKGTADALHRIADKLDQMGGTLRQHGKSLAVVSAAFEGNQQTRLKVTMN